MVCQRENTQHIIINVRNTNFLNPTHEWTLFDLLIIIANAKRIGNYRRLNGIGESEGIIGILDKKTTSPWNVRWRVCLCLNDAISSTAFVAVLLTFICTCLRQHVLMVVRSLNWRQFKHTAIPNMTYILRISLPSKVTFFI